MEGDGWDQPIAPLPMTQIACNRAIRCVQFVGVFSIQSHRTTCSAAALLSVSSPLTSRRASSRLGFFTKATSSPPSC